MTAAAIVSSLFRPEPMSVTYRVDAAWDERGRGCDCVGSAPASAADPQTEGKHHRVDEQEHSVGTEMVSGPKYELA